MAFIVIFKSYYFLIRPVREACHQKLNKMQYLKWALKFNFEILALIDIRSGVLEVSLASRPHFKVLGLGLGLEAQVHGLEAYKSSKMPCPRLKDSHPF